MLAPLLHAAVEVAGVELVVDIVGFLIVVTSDGVTGNGGGTVPTARGREREE